MTHRGLIVLSATLFTLGLQGQDTTSRLGIAVGVAVPSQLKASPGIAAGLNIHFNQNTGNEGRIRIEGVSFGAKTESTSATTLESKGSAWTLGYDWTPGRGAVRAILGIGGMAWTQTLQQQDTGANLGYKAYGGNKSGFAIVPTLGLQFRVSKYISLEGRYAIAANLSNDKNYYFSYGENNDIRQMHYLAIGVEIRTPTSR